MANIGTFSESLEDYLEIIYQLIREKTVARVKDIAEHRSVAMSSVVTALKRLERENLIVYHAREFVQLTPEGEKLAVRIVSRHEFFKSFLVSLLNVSEDTAEKDACSIEHHISPETLRKLVGFFEFIDTLHPNIKTGFLDYCNHIGNQLNDISCHSPTCPYREERKKQLETARSLSHLKPGERGHVWRLLGTPVIRQRLIDMGLLPNVEVTIERVAPLGDPIEIKLRGYHLSLRKGEADAILLQPATASDAA